jgi:hypothetical protein
MSTGASPGCLAGGSPLRVSKQGKLMVSHMITYEPDSCCESHMSGKLHAFILTRQKGAFYSVLCKLTEVLKAKGKLSHQFLLVPKYGGYQIVKYLLFNTFILNEKASFIFVNLQ